MRRLVVLRPEPGASETVRRARELGLDARAVPLFSIEPAEWKLPAISSFDGLLLTSANAVRAIGTRAASLRSLPVHAVGEATAAAARTIGLEVASVGTGGVDDLLGTLPDGLHLLHLCGEDRRASSANRLRIVAVPAYSAVPVDAPDLTALAGAVAMVHSPRAAARLADLAADRSAVAVAAISAAAAIAAGGGWERVEAAERPTDAALLSLAARMCQDPLPE